MESCDLLIIGGGINGTAIARDAAGRGLKVLLVEKDDLAQHTSSASSKLIHGGLRYLEQYEFRLVREALRERETLLRTAPHIVTPLRFVLPRCEGMRPGWMIRAGLLLYDLLARGGSLPRARAIRASERELLGPLKRKSGAFVYWDAWVDDARLVVLNALDAAERGAGIATRTEFVAARREAEVWRAQLSRGREVEAPAIVNAAGPWVADVLGARLREHATSRVRLIKGSHIVVPSLFEGNHAYILQQPDGRVVFAFAYEARFTLIGTTDVPVNAPDAATPTPEEIHYLISAVNLYFAAQVTPAAVVWGYSGVRSLYDDGESDAQSVTRDYRLELDDHPGARLLSVFGGKITTARALAEEALDLLQVGGRSVTRECCLPGGESDDSAEIAKLAAWIPEPIFQRLRSAYGTRILRVVGAASSIGDLGRPFGAGLYEAEIHYLMAHEYACTAEDILWRRTKLGLHMGAAERQAVADFVGG